MTSRNLPIVQISIPFLFVDCGVVSEFIFIPACANHQPACLRTRRHLFLGQFKIKALSGADITSIPCPFEPIITLYPINPHLSQSLARETDHISIVHFVQGTPSTWRTHTPTVLQACAPVSAFFHVPCPEHRPSGAGLLTRVQYSTSRTTLGKVSYQPRI